MYTYASRRNLLIATVIGLAGLSGLQATAQQADVRMRGTIERLDGTELVLKADKGGEIQMALGSTTEIFINQPSSLGAIKAGDYVASAAIKGADGKLRSKEVRIFPEALRGIGEGQRPMDEPGTLMTNASVAEVVAAPDGQVVKVRYKNGTADLIVGPQVPVWSVVAADVSALKPGTKVFISATKSANGTITTTRIITTS
jgi:hypothetical protein